jgi:hypothetical protein
LVAEAFVGFVQATIVAEGDDMIFVETQGGILHVVQLLEDDGGADEQDDGDGELCDDEYFTEGDVAAADL